MTSTIKVNNIQNQCGQNIINENSNTITIGASGDTIALASGASQTGFGRTGTVDWQTGSIKTATFTAANGEGYFANTSGGAFNMNLPAGSAGAIVSVVDYTNTFQTNALTLVPNGSEKIGGVNANATLSTEGQSVTFVYIDATEGWKNVQDSTSNVIGALPYPVATGGTETTCGDFKIHTFTGPGTFTVTSSGTPGGNDVFEYLVVAGGGSGSTSYGGGGAGGLRFASPSLSPATYPAKPLAAPAGLNLPATAYPIQVGGGSTSSVSSPGSRGNPSVFSTITSTGGGGGNNDGGAVPATPGGSGGGGGATGSPVTNGTGNTPPVSPPQGKDGGNGLNVPGICNTGGGGGGAIVAGSAGTSPYKGGPGGDGAGFPTAFGSNGVPCGSFRYYAGGGGASSNPGAYACAGNPGKGGGGKGRNPAQSAPLSTAGAPNTGGGGGGGNSGPGPAPLGAGGGSGIVVIRYKFQN